jgi:phosphoribosylformylglycinamidine synthase
MTCELAVEDAGPSFNPGTLGARIRLPIGHGEGNYRIDEAGRARLLANRQVLLRYVDNPNGSLDGIAGVRSEGGNVFGMMPHPDRAFERFHPSRDGLSVARAVLAARHPDLIRKTA